MTRHLSVTPVGRLVRVGAAKLLPRPARKSADDSGAKVLALPRPAGASWLRAADAELQHGQVWWVKTESNAELWAQVDGYDVVRGKQLWRAIGILSHRQVKVRAVLEGSCPRIGGRRARR